MSSSCLSFYKERIVKLKAMIEAYEDAIIAITSDGVKSYQLNTGQNDSRVTKLDVPDLQAQLDEMVNRLCRWQQKVDDIEAGLGSGRPTQVRACW